MPISLPTVEVAWRYSVLNRIAFTSVLQVTGDTMFTIISRLIAEGWVTKGSCDGTTGAMDGVNRITDGTKFQTRFNGAAGAQSWWVGTDGDGANIGFNFNSATDDVVAFWMSATGVAVAAGTPNQEPTATDKLVMNKFFTTTPGTIVGAGVSGDRLVSIWTTNDAKNFRVAIARANAWQSCFGKERFGAATLAAGITVHPGFIFYLPGDALVGNTTSFRGIIGNCTTTTAGATDQMRCMTWRTDGGGQSLGLARKTTVYGVDGAATAPSITTAATDLPELQGSVAAELRRLTLYSGTVGTHGNVGRMRDWWWGNLGVVSGHEYGTHNLVVVNGGANAFGITWPWDGVTPVVMS